MKARKPKKPVGDTATKPAGNGATTGHEAELWRMADTRSAPTLYYPARCAAAKAHFQRVTNI